MRRRTLWPAGVVASIVAAGAALTATTTATATPAGGHRAAGRPAPAAASDAAARQSATAGRRATASGRPDASVVTLPTGDRLALERDAHGSVRAIHPVGAASQPYLLRRYGTDTYAVPATELSRLGRDLSLADFDVTALAAGRLGRAPGAVRPHLPMHTVTITVTGTDGKPVDGAALAVGNVDDLRKYYDFPSAVDGVAKISVPDGHYSLMAYHAALDAQGTPTEERILFDTFTVAGSALAVSLKLAEANERLSVHTPHRAVPREMDLRWRRSSNAAGTGMQASVMSNLDHPIYLNASPADVGSQNFYVHATLTSPAQARTPYLYDVEFPAEGAIGDSYAYRVTPDSVARLDTRYYGDQTNHAEASWIGFVPWDMLGPVARAQPPLTMPAHRIEYLTARPDLVYARSVTAKVVDGTAIGGLQNGFVSLEPGTRRRVDWYRGPLVPGIAELSNAESLSCAACRQSDTLTLRLSPLTDSTPTHFSYRSAAETPSQHLVLYRDGTAIADEQGTTSATVQVPADEASYRFVFDQTRVGEWSALSTRTHTEWRFASAHSGTSSVPDRMPCADGTTADCTALPLLLPRYQLRESLHETLPVGHAAMTLTLRHAPAAEATPVRSATVSVSFDGGTSWTAAKTEPLGGNRFGVRWSDPRSAAGRTIALRVSATDTAGSAVEQTSYDVATVQGGTR